MSGGATVLAFQKPGQDHLYSNNFTQLFYISCAVSNMNFGKATGLESRNINILLVVVVFIIICLKYYIFGDINFLVLFYYF